MLLLQNLFRVEGLEQAVALKLFNGQVVRFLLTFDEKRIVGEFNEELSAFCKTYASFLVKRGRALLGIHALKRAIMRVQRSSDEVTPLHRALAKLCLKAKCYDHAEEVISQHSITYNAVCSEMDILVYNYYRGLLFTGLKRHEEAIHCFRLAVAQPSMVMHEAILESYKKLLLVSLLHADESPALPKYTSYQVRNKLRTLASSYISFVEAYKKKDDKAL